MSNLINHIEYYLGTIDGGRGHDINGIKLPFQVTQHSNINYLPEIMAISTIGLSNHIISCQTTQNDYRFELLMLTQKSQGCLNIPGIIQQIALEIINEKKVLLRGDVIGPRGQLFNDSELTSLYATSPMYFPDSFSILESDSSVPVIFIWLVPITTYEAEFINNNGWDKFENIFEEINPDILDFNRKTFQGRNKSLLI